MSGRRLMGSVLVIIWVKLQGASKEMARDWTEGGGAEREKKGGGGGGGGGEGIKEAENH